MKKSNPASIMIPSNVVFEPTKMFTIETVDVSSFVDVGKWCSRKCINSVIIVINVGCPSGEAA